ncbi:PqiC family protein [Sphingomonas bacterium]|uniref:PqiC family protein n=1 Tax=Sphingomonas bacterium TaxID=1895847 RepID=UPI001575CED9|nr:ABC-type transport auxiliary lipoprotein family protein [Sphingomonas bacterium]
MRYALSATIAGALMLAGCGHSPATTFLTIDPAPPPAPPASYRGAPLRVPFVHVPVTLDRPEYVSQPSAGTLKVADFARWSAPLGRLARDTLIRDLTQRLAAGAVLAPDAAPTKPETVVQATVLDFTPARSGPGSGSGATATMTVSFRVGPSPVPHVVQLQAPLAGDTPVDAARAWSALIGQLADRVVAELPAPR